MLLLLAVAGVCWWWVAEQMAGMGSGPWTALGSPGWFIGAWTVMMAAMMFPSVAPTVALYARMTGPSARLLPLAFTTGYLVVWVATGGLALAVAEFVGTHAGNALGWDQAGRALTVATLLFAAAYEFTPLKRVCLGKCRSPLSFLLGTWRPGWRGGLLMGAKLGVWCLGCCWVLMAALFALGVMSIGWMGLVAGLITMEKLLPWRRAATFATAATLVGLAVLAVVSPTVVPGRSPVPATTMSTVMSAR